MSNPDMKHPELNYVHDACAVCALVLHFFGQNTSLGLCLGQSLHMRFHIPARGWQIHGSHRKDVWNQSCGLTGLNPDELTTQVQNLRCHWSG